MNVNNGAQQYTRCLSAAAEDAAVPMTPVCGNLYIDDVVHYFVEARSRGQSTQRHSHHQSRADGLIIDAVVQREHRLDRLYRARIQMDGYEFILENTSYRVSNGEIHVWFPSLFDGPQVSPPRSPL